MTALLQLLVPTVSSGYSPYWPVASLSKTKDDDVAFVVAAVPLFNSIVLGGFSMSKRWPPSEDATYSFGFCAFLAKWAKKVCTSIKHAYMPYELDLLEAVTTPAHNVPDLDLCSLHAKHYPLEAALLIQRWLASGPRRRITFRMLHATRDAGLARVLALSPHITKLELVKSEGILAALASNGARCTYLPELTIHVYDEPGRVLPLLNPRVLRKLSVMVYELAEVVGLAPALAELVALEQLTLKRIDLRTLPRINAAAVTTMRKLKLCFVECTATSVANVLDWVTRSPCLESVVWMSCAVFGADIGCAIDTVQRCIRSLAHTVAFEDCGIDTHGATALAHGLRNTHARHRIMIDLSRNKMLIAAARALLSALATCTNVSIKLTNSLRTLSVDDDAQAKQAGVTIEWCLRNEWPSYVLTLHSTRS
ncbi:hypothetical protein SDRG_17123 [Saprolegnia diclina VS20]|uniref:F-box domain-containing protein n=1 Tax=Saprolegnia diclina (strain VS20) TaxID=1156394 RepID=T0QZ34_SAPDV|nr:hypothetical protein SDRG_17123 [Saprolegnia diclina VS20]EQC25003.1 hypothetical protein SDRG_17123 [Saprolegnia diclina VS20]|eukprot:XP_008621580.1 hypothetical protein SDRG_17123 [Saprolegnia diclina VS20]